MHRDQSGDITQSPVWQKLIDRLNALPPEEADRVLTSPKPGELTEEELALIAAGRSGGIIARCPKCGRPAASYSHNANHDCR